MIRRAAAARRGVEVTEEHWEFTHTENKPILELLLSSTQGASAPAMESIAAHGVTSIFP